jgi:hypothetical protein
MQGAFNVFLEPAWMVRSPSASTRSAPQQPFVAIDGKAARIGDAAVMAESAERLAVSIEGDKCAVSIAIGAGRAGKERQANNLVAGCSDRLSRLLFLQGDRHCRVR